MGIEKRRDNGRKGWGKKEKSNRILHESLQRHITRQEIGGKSVKKSRFFIMFLSACYMHRAVICCSAFKNCWTLVSQVFFFCRGRHFSPVPWRSLRPLIHHIPRAASPYTPPTDPHSTYPLPTTPPNSTAPTSPDPWETHSPTAHSATPTKSSQSSPTPAPHPRAACTRA